MKQFPFDIQDDSNPPARHMTKEELANAAPTLRTRDPDKARGSPYLITPRELRWLKVGAAILFFGSVLSLAAPESHAAYDPATQTFADDPLRQPTYFARKSNHFNQLYVKKGWGWTSFFFFMFLTWHPAMVSTTGGRQRAFRRYLILTGWWYAVTQWFFGPAIIDRGFRLSGGACDGVATAYTGAACKAGGGKWSGGHDISGHVFLLVLASGFLLEEVGYVARRYAGFMGEERSVIMADGSAKSAAALPTGMEEGEGEGEEAYGLGGFFSIMLVLLNCWMLLMTALYFHTWPEKLTGFIAAVIPLYIVYIVPRFSPTLREMIGMPAI